MKLWCSYCQTAVEPEVKREKEFHGEVDSRCYEEYDVYRCPICGEEVYLDPGECAMCGEPCDPFEELCGNCKEEVEGVINTLAEVHGHKNAIEGLSAYISEVE